MEVMAGLAVLADRIPDLAAWKPQVLVEQLSRSLKRELNSRANSRTSSRFRASC